MAFVRRRAFLSHRREKPTDKGHYWRCGKRVAQIIYASLNQLLIEEVQEEARWKAASLYFFLG
jgi:hypothetical protein